jgi:hypothetical protein
MFGMHLSRRRNPCPPQTTRVGTAHSPLARMPERTCTGTGPSARGLLPITCASNGGGGDSAGDDERPLGLTPPQGDPGCPGRPICVTRVQHLGRRRDPDAGERKFQLLPAQDTCLVLHPGGLTVTSEEANMALLTSAGFTGVLRKSAGRQLVGFGNPAIHTVPMFTVSICGVSFVSHPGCACQYVMS